MDISEDEIVFPTVVEQQVDPFFRSIDQLKMNLQGAGVGESNYLRNEFHPHLQSVVNWAGNRTEWIVVYHFRCGSLGIFLFTASHERDPSVDTARRGTACECDHGNDTDRNTKMHAVRLTDDALGCKP